jgi:hypothetical protein
VTYPIAFACYGRRLHGSESAPSIRRWKPQHISAAMRYVVGEQGAAMSVFGSHEL